MSISTNIDGSSGNAEANQVFNLLAVVANPDVYADKVRTLMEATAEHKKFLALVAPANEIVAIRQQIDQDKAAAKAELEAARQEASKLVDVAKVEARDIVEDAKAQGVKINAASRKTEKQAAEKMAASVEAENRVAQALADAQDQQKALDAKIKAVENTQAQYEKLKAEHEALKASLIAKHKRHLQELEA